MTPTTSIIVVTILLMVYYVGAIVYDLYIGHMLEMENDKPHEEPIEVSGSLEEFETHTVEKPTAEQDDRAITVSNLCKALTPVKCASLLTDIVEGSQNEELNNYCHYLRQTSGSTDDEAV